jgi:hypothetical protein
MLDSNEREALTYSLNVWLEHHPEPDVPVFRIAGDGELTPREVVEAVNNRSEIGNGILDILEFSVRRSSIDEVTSSFEHGQLVN